MSENREYIRYTVEQSPDFSAIVEIEGTESLNGMVSDLSAGGFSFSIDLENIGRDNVDLQKFFFIRLKIGELSIYSEVEKRWGLVRDQKGKRIYSAGVSFNVISGEDRLRLNEIIEKIRSRSAADHE